MPLQGSDRLLCGWTVAKYPEHRGAAARHEDSFRPKAQQTFFERGNRRIGWEDRAFQIVDQPLARGATDRGRTAMAAPTLESTGGNASKRR